MHKPFLKWVGGKTQIISELSADFPESIGDFQVGNIFAYDINPALINTYNQIKNNCPQVCEELDKHIAAYSAGDQEKYYYAARKEFNEMSKDTPSAAAMFIFLNKTCFRGMYRECPNGFNVPFGHYKTICAPDLTIYAGLFANVEFKCCGFEESLASVGFGDFVYLDPPYVPEKINSFVGYNAAGFTEHEKLFNMIIALHDEGADFMMSNSNSKLVRDTFSAFCIMEISARRAINAKKPGATTTELLILNFHSN